MDVRDALLQRINQRIMRAREAFDRFDDASAEREMVGLKWNVRDLAGHLLFWANEGTKQIPALTAGGELPDYDLDGINEKTCQKNRRMSFVVLRQQLREAEERLLRAVSSVPPHLLRNETPVRQAVDGFAIAHYEHHWPGLRTAVARLSGEAARL